MDKEDDSHISNKIDKSLKNWKNSKDRDQLEIQMSKVRNNSKKIEEEIKKKVKLA